MERAVQVCQVGSDDDDIDVLLLAYEPKPSPRSVPILVTTSGANVPLVELVRYRREIGGSSGSGLGEFRWMFARTCSYGRGRSPKQGRRPLAHLPKEPTAFRRVVAPSPGRSLHPPSPVGCRNHHELHPGGARADPARPPSNGG